jgi:cytochrome c oxidase assembly factor 6
MDARNFAAFLPSSRRPRDTLTTTNKTSMGWFASDKAAAPEAPKASGDGGFIAPDRNKRAHCWEARDAYFACLDKNSIIDSVKRAEEADSLCAAETTKFNQNCASSWVCSCTLGLLALTAS